MDARMIVCNVPILSILLAACFVACDRLDHVPCVPLADPLGTSST